MICNTTMVTTQYIHRGIESHPMLPIHPLCHVQLQFAQTTARVALALSAIENPWLLLKAIPRGRSYQLQHCLAQERWRGKSRCRGAAFTTVLHHLLHRIWSYKCPSPFRAHDTVSSLSVLFWSLIYLFMFCFILDCSLLFFITPRQNWSHFYIIFC